MASHFDWLDLCIILSPISIRIIDTNTPTNEIIPVICSMMFILVFCMCCEKFDRKNEKYLTNDRFVPQQYFPKQIHNINYEKTEINNCPE